jgi:SAM-dependent methyltransferase
VPLYDRIGQSYAAARRADPRFAAVIAAGLGDARTVVNVGAGTGSYEPTDRDVTAVEPSPVMIAQRPTGAAPVIQARAERLPFEDRSFDAAMAIFSDHHWEDRAEGMRELRRVARRRVVLFNANPGELDLFWFTNEYLPEFLDLIPEPMRGTGAWEEGLDEHVDWAVDALRADLASGAWERRHRDLLELAELHLGYYVVVVELNEGDG